MAVVYVPNPLGIIELGLSPAMVVECGVIAEGVSAVAKSIAPVDTGAYAASIQTETTIEDGHAVGRVFSDISYAAFLEFGTIDTPVFGTLRQAAETFKL